MEPILPLTSSSPQTSSYKRYSVYREPNIAPVVQIHSREFFYIGKNTRSIDYLVNLFDGGYAAENISKALNILKRIDQQQKAIPNVFIIDSAIELSAVAELNAFLTTGEKFRGIPVIMDKVNSTTDPADPGLLMRIFDDVIDTRKVDNKLLNRINFLEKVKQKKFSKTQETIRMIERVRKNSKLGVGRRAFDILVSLIGIILMSPIMVLIALAIKLESKGPVFYISKRAGRGYRVFNFYKFRTMQCDADKKVDQLKQFSEYDEEKCRVFFKVSDDPRATRIGKFLRNSSLDELPQFFNVLLGDMSLVGNRPLPLYEAAMLTTDEWAERFMAPAGITGLWQIRKKDRHYMSDEERIKLDITYSKKQNFLFDLWIIAHTPPALIQKSNV
ncbi:sugar transferase [Flavihumibacter profundi]|uniref:sugar transferase n=1 Tax=Flavihumibacter profundi TaxID=2716883 RepID=UPI001CC409EE|nr:sugar transferase [Flavihumibacter profundi]MBZ5859276.1 sugar transferase [Flavihumibacter profundi]